MTDMDGTKANIKQRLIIALILSFLGAEVASMLLMALIPENAPLLSIILDSSLEIICVLPCFYFFVLKPITRSVDRSYRIEYELHERNEQIQLYVDVSAALVLELDRSGTIRKINRKGCEILGYDSAELIGTNWFDCCIPPESREEVRHLHSHLIAGAISCCADVENEILHRSGERLFITFRNSLLHDASGQIIGTISSGVDMTPHNRAERALKGERERLANIIRGTNVGTWEWNVQTGGLVVNDRWAHILGYSLHELSPVSIETWCRLCEPNDLKLSEDYLARHFRGELAYYELELRMRHRDGHWVWVLDRGQVMSWTADGKPLMMMGTHQDITTRKQAEERARRAARLDSILLSIYGESVALPEQEFCTRALDEAVKLTDSQIGFFHRISEDQQNVILTAWNNEALRNCTAAYNVHYPVAQAGNWVDCLREGRPVVYNDFPQSPHRKGLPEGHTPIRRFMSVPVLESGKCRLIFGVGNKVEPYDELDVTHMQLLATELNKILRQRESKRIIQTSEDRFRAISEHALTGIWILQEGRICYTNPILVSQLGYSLEELTSISPLDLVHPSDRSIATPYLGATAVAECSLQQIELRLSNRLGDWLDYSLLVTQIDWDGRPATLCNLMNVTEVKRLKEQESRAQRLETIGRIAGQVAHDFNNLLGPIMAYPELIREELPEQSHARQFLNYMEEAAVRIAAINQDLLTLGRRGHYAIEVVNLNNLITHALKDLAPLPPQVTCSLQLTEDLMCVKGGSAQLYRAIANLVHNAVDALESGGELAITTENYYAENVSIAYQRVPRGEYVKLTIADTGCGISDDILQRIFEPFFTTKKTDGKHGSGLGLSVVNNVLKDHGGFLDLRTTIGVGTTFYVYLPACREVGPCETIENRVGGTERILVVDDDDMQRAVLSSLLGRLGYHSSVAASGEAALQMLSESSFDLIVLDMIMPGGMDGADTYCQASRLYPGQKAIIVSGFSESGRVEVAQRAGAGAFVKKPLTLAALASAVRTELDRPVARPALVEY